MGSLSSSLVNQTKKSDINMYFETILVSTKLYC